MHSVQTVCAIVDCMCRPMCAPSPAPVKPFARRARRAGRPSSGGKKVLSSARVPAHRSPYIMNEIAL